MSRCFPFPPPGYEARPRSEQQRKDLLKKEKHKEKKQRKENDRVKGERKEKDTDHRKDKRNKKHKREKHRERRKNEDRDKDKKQSWGQETQKNYDHGNRMPEERGQNEAAKDIKPAVDLANHKCDNNRSLLPRNTDSIGATGSKEKERNSLSRMVKKSAETTQDNHGMVQKGDSTVRGNRKGMGRGVDSKTKIKNRKSLQVGSAEMHSRRKQSCNAVDVQQDHSNAQRISVDVHTASPVVSGSAREANGRITPSPNTLQSAEEMEPDLEIAVHSAKGKNDRINTKGGMMGKENQSANNCLGKMNQQSVQDKDGEMEGKAKTNYFKAVKSEDRGKVVKKRKTEYKNRVKEMEKNGTVNEYKQQDLGVRRDNNLMNLGFHNENKFTSNNLKKRKDYNTNSSPHEHSMKMTKLPRLTPTKDEKNCRHSQQIAPNYSTCTKACGVDRHKPQDGYNNDIASVSSSGYKNNKGYPKQPHPDTKYLSQLYSIPSAQDFSDYIDQDWLFSQDRDEWKPAASEAAESDHVWSDAQIIDTADVIALPYVVAL